jgi:hypothetical protein
MEQAAVARDSHMLALPALPAKSQTGQTLSLRPENGVCEEETSWRLNSQIFEMKREWQIADTDDGVVPRKKWMPYRPRRLKRLF